MEQLPNQRPTLTRPILLFLIVLFVFIGFQGVIMTLPVDVRVGVMITQLVVILGGALAYRRFFAHPSMSWPKLKRLGMSPWALIVVLVTSISLGFLANALGALTVQVFPALAPMAEQYQDTIQHLLLPESMQAQILGAVAVAVVAPLCEEVLFRGTILTEQQRSQTAAGAILLNGFLFSLMHLNPVALLSLTVVGVYFAHVTVRSGSLWGALLGHAILNLVNGVILIRLAGDMGSPDEFGWLEVGVALGVLIPVTALLWWYGMRLIGDRSDSPTPR